MTRTRLQAIICGGQIRPKRKDPDLHEVVDPPLNMRRGACRDLAVALALICWVPLLVMPGPLGLYEVEYPDDFPADKAGQYIFLLKGQLATLGTMVSNASVDDVPWPAAKPVAGKPRFWVALLQGVTYLFVIGFGGVGGKKIFDNWSDLK